MADTGPLSTGQGSGPLTKSPGPSSEFARLDRFLKGWCLASASVVMIIALLAMIGWHTGNSSLFQILPQFAPMQYNTAICFIGCAAALVCSIMRWRVAALAFTFPAFLVATLSLAEDLYGITIGDLDQLFMDAYVDTRTAHPGRPSLLTSLSFTLTALALFGAVLRRGNQIASAATATLSSLVLSISLLGCFGYLVGLTGAQSWTLMAGMSVPTVIGFLILGSGLLVVSWRDFRKHHRRSPHWVPIAVLMAATTITLILADAIHSEEQRNIRIKNHSNAVAMQITLVAELTNRQQSIRRMANRQANTRNEDRARWEIDAKQYLADDTGYRFIAWADENLIYRWVVPETAGIIPGITTALPEDGNALEMLGSLRRSANVGIRHIGENGNQLCVISAIINDQGNFGGYIIASFNNRVFFNSLIPTELAQGYDFKISVDDKAVHQRGPEGIPKNNPWITEKTFQLYGSDWKIDIWPTAETLSTDHIFYSKLIITMGLIVSALLSIATYLSQIALSKSRQSAQRNIRLQQEIAERIRSQDELQRASALNKAIVLHSAHAVISADPTGIITSFNPAAERMLGHKAEELIGKHTPAIIHDLGEVAVRASQLSRQYGEKVEPGFDVFVYEARKGIDSQIEWTYVRKNGSRFPVSLAVTAIADEQGQINGYLGVAVDISELKYAMAELKNTHKQLLDAALETGRMKSQFLANMSHEIRTPMNGVLGMAELLAATELTETQKEYVEIINQSGAALLNIINDILDSAKIESGKIELHEVPFSIHEVCKGVIQTVQATAIKKGIGLQAEVDAKITSNLVGDPGRLRQVLLNLVSNAVKFTNKGGVTLHVDLLDDGEDRYKLCFRVNDTGIGINPDHLARIFQPFTQADNTDKRLYGGTGLGLTISSQLVQAMGGAIRVKSDENQGSEFWFNLTFPKTTQTAQNSMGPDGAQTYASKTPSTITSRHRMTFAGGLKILLAEDNPVNQQVTTMQLKRLGHEADIASNGQEVLDALSRKNYDVILMDCQMPVMDGYEATRLIREEHSKTIHIIALTANAMKEDRKRCLDAGMNDYLSKPLTATDLAKALEKMKSDSSDNPSSSESTDEIPQAEAVDFERLREVTGNNEGLFKEIAAQYLEQAEEILKELEQTVQTANQVESAKLAHKLAGSSATCGMNAVVHPLRAMEALKPNQASQAGQLLEEIKTQMNRIRQALDNHS